MAAGYSAGPVTSHPASLPQMSSDINFSYMFPLLWCIRQIRYYNFIHQPSFTYHPSTYNPPRYPRLADHVPTLSPLLMRYSNLLNGILTLFQGTQTRLLVYLTPSRTSYVHGSTRIDTLFSEDLFPPHTPSFRYSGIHPRRAVDTHLSSVRVAALLSLVN